MANKRDYYEVLGVGKNATDDEIKKAYRKKAKECHPDLHPDDKEAVERFKELNEANEVLSDPQKRARYDQYGFEDPMAGMGGGGNPFAGGFDFGMGDIFDQLLTAVWAEAPGVRDRYREMICGMSCALLLKRQRKAVRRASRFSAMNCVKPVKAAEQSPVPAL